MSVDDPGYQSELNFSSKEVFFLTPARNGLLQQILHLAEFGNGVVVLEGEHDSGKSGFVQYLVEQYHVAPSSKNLKTIFISLPEPIAVEPFFECVCEQIGLPIVFESTGQILADLRNYVQSLVREQKLAVLVIDDASFLNDEALAALFSVLDVDASSCGLQLVLTGLPGFSSRLDDLTVTELSIHDFSMPYFSPSELEKFIQDLFPNLNNLLLGEAADWTRQSLWSQSRGIPGAAVKLLKAARSGSVSEEYERSTFLTHFKWPYVHSAILIVLLSIFLWLIFGRYDVNSEAKAGQDIQADEFLGGSSSVDNKGSDKGIIVGEALQAPTFQSVSESTIVNDIEKVSGGKRSSEKELAQSKKRTNSPLMNTSSKLRSVADNPSRVSTVERPSSILTTKKETPAPYNSSLASEKSEQQGLIGEGTTKDVEATPAPPLSEPQKVAVDSVIRVLTSDEQFLLSLPQSDYVLQILAVSQKDSAVAFIKENAGSADLRLYRTLRQGKPWFVVVIASFSSRQAAVDGISRLPLMLKKSGPWAKPLSTVFKEIGENS